MVRSSRQRRIFDAVLRSERVRFRDFEALLAGLGFAFVRQSGSHRIHVHPKLDRPFPVQADGKDAKRYQVRELRDMIRKHALTLDESR